MKNEVSAFTNVLQSPKIFMADLEVGIFQKSFDAVVIDSFSQYIYKYSNLPKCVFFSQCHRFKVYIY